MAKHRELYIDVFRGLMALLMVQGHVFETVLSPAARALPLYQLQLVVHGSTAPGFLFASGFVAGLPRAPLSLRASLRRARRLLFVWGVGYALHLPYASLWKTLAASPAEKALLYACDALQVIALSQLVVIALQAVFGVRWTRLALVFTLVVLAAGPWVWSARVAERVHPAVGAYLDMRTGSHFPVFPFSAFVLAGTVAGAELGRQQATRRRRRGLAAAAALIASGAILSLALAGRVDFWGVSPGYVLLRLGGLLLVLLATEAAAAREGQALRALALLGHETLQVFCLHLFLLYGGVVVDAPPLVALHHALGFGGAFVTLLAMLPALLAAAALWNALKQHAPHGAQLALVFLGTAFAYEFLTRPY
ncbi:MAG TPA: acyltransferase family protein [Vicinamibacteria bacterium]|nr:acyltransferase family protein [Vicinamibacteria bacterium]